jgi:alkanesulfonate monooxygenase SsuD/methylene tetrahydromethanopterin reductase-like flavin-dependent oxidoreductase (luciferase family)
MSTASLSPFAARDVRMKAGLFLMPSHPPERATIDAHRYDLETISLADELGYGEAWIGEHFTAPWEPVPSPDLLIAQALMQTKNIRLGAGAHLLPYHHPVELALRVAYLDHMAQGRLLLGIGAGGLQTDAILVDVNFDEGENREMTREALEVMLFVWRNESDSEEWKWASLRNFISPLQKPHPPIGVAAASPRSETLKIAGERGYLPMSLGLGPAYIASHWESVLEGAAHAWRRAAIGGAILLPSGSGRDVDGRR